MLSPDWVTLGVFTLCIGIGCYQRLQPRSPEGTDPEHCSGLLTHAQESSGCPRFVAMLLQGQLSCFPAPFASPLAAPCSDCSTPHRGFYIVCPTYQAMWEDGALGCRYPWVLDGRCISWVGSYPLFPRLNYEKILLFDTTCWSALAQMQSLVVRESLCRGWASLWVCMNQRSLGGHKILSVDCYVMLWLFLKHANLLQSIVAGEKGCSIPLPQDWHWYLLHQAKVCASLAEPVSSADCWAPPGCAGGLSVAKLTQRAWEESGEGSLPWKQKGWRRKVCISHTPYCCGRARHTSVINRSFKSLS